MSKVVIIGAGLAGSLLAIYLARRDIAVDVYESRGDMRLEGFAAGRSINLALSDRGVAALREVGMDEYMLAEAVPMYGRMIHSPAGETKLLPYSGRKGEYINSVSRSGLNIALMNEAEKYARVCFYFHERCVGFDCSSGDFDFRAAARCGATRPSPQTAQVRPCGTRCSTGALNILIFRSYGWRTVIRSCLSLDWSADILPATLYYLAA